MARFTFLLACLVVFIFKTRSTVFEERDGEVALESVIHFHDGNSSIPMMDLSDLLLLISNKTAGVEENLLADPEVSVFYTLGVLIRRTVNYFQHSLLSYTYVSLCKPDLC